MATKAIEKRLPKTTAYINWIFATEGKERGGIIIMLPSSTY